MYAYNPRKKTPQQLERSLVGSDRWDILNNILKELTLKDGEGPKQHWMIIGPRGIGKSHLLTLLYYKVKADQKLSNRWIPVLFPEELRMASSLSKFLERAIHETFLELEEEKNPISDELEQKVKKIRGIPASERADYIFSLISWFHQATGKFILFITENLQKLLGKKISVIEQKKLRAYLQTSDAALLIGSATTIFSALHDHSQPFYHFFHITRLEDLSFEDMKALIVTILSDSERPEFVKKVFDNEPRLKALYSFTGGNPRMAVFLSDILKTEVPDEMLSVMDNILDELTPYFEAILNEIPDYLEEIINTLAAFEPAQSPKEIAEHLEAPQTTIRNYLKQLKESGYVRIAFSKGKSNYYCLNEYLYRLWYQMRDSGHKEETRWLMELLLILYSPGSIIDEKKQIDACVHEDEATLPYKKLIVQAANFISRNPDYCDVIERCVGSIIADREKTIKQKKEEELFKQAGMYRKKNNYADAIKNCKEILTINPKSKWAYLLWGVCLRDQERYEEAIEKFKKLVKINPKSERAYWFWGDCLREQEHYEEAIEKFKKTIKIDPKAYAAYGALGDCFRELSLYDEAEKKYKKAIKINNGYEDAFAAWGYCLRNQERYEEAIEKFKKLVKINPKSERAYWFWGDCLRSQERYEEAIEKFKKLVKINPKSEQAYRAWGDCLQRQEHYEEAIEKFKKSVKINPKSEDAYGFWGDCLRSQARYEEAIEKFKKVIEINPKSERAYWLWGDCLRNQERYEEAIEKFKKAIKIDPKAYVAYGALGDCFRELGLYDEAEKKYKKAIKINNGYEDAFAAWGYCLRSQERYEDAIEKFKKVIGINPKSERAYWFWGDCLRSQERYEEAIEKFKKLVKINPKSERAYESWFYSLVDLKRFNEAIKIYERVLHNSKRYWVIYYYGTCLMEMKRYNEALKQFENLINIRHDCHTVYLPYGQLLEKLGNKEGSLISYIKYIKLIFKDSFVDFNFEEIYKKHILPVLKTLTPGDYTKQFYALEENSKLSSPQLGTLLILLDKYDVVSEHIRDIISAYVEKDKKEKEDFVLLIFTIKLKTWLKLCEGNLYEALRLVELYIEYLKSLKTSEEKENEVSNLVLSLFKLQIKKNIEAGIIQSILKRINDEDGIPFNDVLFKVWTCISEPDSVKAQRYLNEKAIGEVVKELKKKDVQTNPLCSLVESC